MCLVPALLARQEGREEEGELYRPDQLAFIVCVRDLIHECGVNWFIPSHPMFPLSPPTNRTHALTSPFSAHSHPRKLTASAYDISQHRCSLLSLIVTTLHIGASLALACPGRRPGCRQQHLLLRKVKVQKLQPGPSAHPDFTPRPSPSQKAFDTAVPLTSPSAPACRPVGHAEGKRRAGLMNCEGPEDGLDGEKRILGPHSIPLVPSTRPIS